MSDSDAVRPSTTFPTAEAKAEARRWVEQWKVVGPLLEAERWARLQAASEATLQDQAWDLLSLWQPGVAGDDGEAVRLQQRVFARLGHGEVT